MTDQCVPVLLDECVRLSVQ